MNNCLHKRVLIIDDERTILELLRRFLFTIGFALDVEVAENAEEGIKKILNTSYDLILTDIQMTGMSGNDLCDYVKNNLGQAVPIVAMSGTPWLLEHSNFDAVLAKPFRKETFLDIVCRFVQGAGTKNH